MWASCKANAGHGLGNTSKFSGGRPYIRGCLILTINGQLHPMCRLYNSGLWPAGMFLQGSSA
jgi:hypothetical protein